MSDRANLVRVLTASTGTSTMTLGTAYSQLFMTSAEAGMVDGRTYTYLIVDGNNWELGKGVYTASGTTLSRVTVLQSRISGTLGTTKVTLSGTAQVRIIESSDDMGALRGTRAVTGTTDTIAQNDLGRAITYSNASAIAASLAQAGASSQFLDGWSVWVQNLGAGALTITPATSTINAGATLVLAQNLGAYIWSDGTNYHAYIIPITKPLLAANNLADVASASTSRTNLGATAVGSSLFTATDAAAARSAIGVEKKNYIINGAMMVSQENGTTAGTVANYYPVDQFAATFSNAGAVSFAQVASVTPAGSPNRFRLTVTTADASVGSTDRSTIYTKIEGYRCADLLFGTASAKTITIQFGVKAPAGTYSVVVINSAFNRSYVADYVISGGEANTDVVKSVTIPGDQSGTWLKDNGVGLTVYWCLMAGSTNQQAPGSWGTGNIFGSTNQFNFMGTLSNVFELFDVGLYEGSVAPAFIVPKFSDELATCMRYWEKSYDYALAPGSISTNGMLGSVLFMSSATFTGGGINPLFKVIKRTAATVTIYSPDTGASGKIRDRSNGVDVTPFATDLIGDYGFRSFVQTLTANATLAIYLHFTANARL